MKRIFLLALGFAGCCGAAQAQIRLGDGQLTGSFETNTIGYFEDDGVKGMTTPPDHFGSNNYMKADYTYKKFSAGVQVDAYLPALQGYDGLQDGYKFYLSSKYIQWQDRNFEVLVGDIFDQLGNGLIFRSYEDRQLGLNNSLEGVRGIYRFSRFVELKGMYGRPRLYTDYAESWVRALDLRLSMNDVFNWNAVTLSLEGSYVNRYEALDKDEMIDFGQRGLTSPNLNMWSGRLNFDWNGLSLRGEYVTKSKDLTSAIAAKAVSGNAVYGEIGYNYKTLSLSGTFRRLEDMGTMLTLYGTGTGNSLNYLPALTRQYTYMLANLEPYQVSADGELAGQADVYYSLRSKENRYRYWNFHVNFSTAYTLHAITPDVDEHQLMWRDINFDVERQWNKSWKTIFLFSRQEYSPSRGSTDELYTSNIFVGDVTYKFNRKYSLRWEVQYLLSDDYEGDWVAGLVEFNIAPKWSVFFSDMYNLGETKTNYYNGGFSFTKNRTRIQLGYGRNREGYVCSGGVCRLQPAYTGLNLVLTSSF